MDDILRDREMMQPTYATADLHDAFWVFAWSEPMAFRDVFCEAFHFQAVPVVCAYHYTTAPPTPSFPKIENHEARQF